MNGNERPKKPAQGSSARNHRATFAKVLDARKRPIRGLWIRNGRYYAQLAIENPLTGAKRVKRVPLVNKDGGPPETAAQAVAELKRLQTKRADNDLPVLDRTPKFQDHMIKYLAAIDGTKKPGTVAKEKAILGRWAETIGHLRIDQIKRLHVNRFIEARIKEKAAPRTINLDVIGLRSALKRAMQDGVLQRLPTEGLRPLKTVTARRQLYSAQDLEKLFAAAFTTRTNADGKQLPVTENAQQIVDYLKVMALSGVRRSEALGLQWNDVDFENHQMHVRRQITVRGEESLKNSEQRTVDFNPRLEAHVKDMHSRRAPDSVWLFPSPQRGEKDIPAKSFQESLKMVRKAAKMPHFTFHDCRHHFISMSVMSGIDFMTIAAWVGHKDGGVLIGKVYSHLANEHRKAMAQRLSFDPINLKSAA